MNKSSTLAFALVATSAGSIDRSASLEAAAKALDSHIAEYETQQATIADAVSAVFDEHKGTGVALTMPTVAGLVLTQLNAQPANYKALGVQVLDYLRANAETVTKSGPSGTKLFGIKKGVGGGISRWSDAAAPAAGSDAPEADESSDTEAE